LWKHLDYDDLINLCQSNSLFNSICLSNNTWIYLIYRDFGFAYNGQNAHDTYLLYKTALDLLTEYFPIVTQLALYELVETISNPKSEDLRLALNIFKNNWEDEFKIFTIQVLQRVFNETYDAEEDDGSYVIQGTNKVVTTSDYVSNIIKDKYKNYNNIVTTLKKTNSTLKSAVKYDTIIFVNKQLTVVPYDYELAVQIIDTNSFYADKFFDIKIKLYDIENQLLQLI
jgi:hypothetical protein